MELKENKSAATAVTLKPGYLQFLFSPSIDGAGLTEQS